MAEFTLTSTSSYYDIDDILCEEQDVPCTVLHDCLELGYLEAIGQEDLHEKSKLDLPYWSASYMSSRDHFQMNLPVRLYGKRIIDRIQADPVHIDLHERAAYYYELGLKMALQYTHQATLDSLNQIYGMRYVELLHRSTIYRSHDYHAYYMKLDEHERQSFDIKHYVNVCQLQWENRSTLYVKQSHIANTVTVLSNITNTANAAAAAAANGNNNNSALQRQPSKFGNGNARVVDGRENQQQYGNENAKRQRM